MSDRLMHYYEPIIEDYFMEPIITRVTLPHAESLADISRRTFYDTFKGTCTEMDMQSFLDEYLSLQRIQNELSDKDDYYYFAAINNEPVGYIRFMEDYSNFAHVKQWKALELKRLYVVKTFHGKRIAQALMDFTLDYAAKNKYELVWLGVWEHNVRAQKFYSKYGFINSGYKHDFPIGNTSQMDEWFWKFL